MSRYLEYLKSHYYASLLIRIFSPTLKFLFSASGAHARAPAGDEATGESRAPLGFRASADALLAFS